MPYLRLHDYLKTIQNENLLQIINSDDSIRTDSEKVAIEEIKSYLIQKYDVAEEFKDVISYDSTIATYKANYTFTLDSLVTWNNTTTFPVNFIVVYLGQVYSSRANGNVGHNPSTDITQTYWNLLGTQYTLYYTITPQSRFDYSQIYNTGQKVFWKDKIYTCQISVANIYPDDILYGVQYWGIGISYIIPMGSLLNTVYFLPGDIRSQQMVEYSIDLTLYHIHKSVAPKNIPDLRVKAYDDVISWLKNCAKGNDITPNLIKLTPRSGGRIRYGSIPRQTNYY